MRENKNNKFQTNISPNVEVDLDENRIDWERKQKHKRRVDGEVVEGSVDNDTDLVTDNPDKRNKKNKKKKRRQLVFDETRGQVIVKRRRRRQYESLGDWDEEF